MAEESRREKPPKPIGIKAYGSIGHLPNSRMGPGDSHIAPGQARICCETTRDRHDLIIVQEKIDGSCTAVVKVDGKIIALGKAGYLAATSPYEQHHLFARWVDQNHARFDDVLEEGERLVGEWLAQAHGTRYDLPHEPWVAFDLMTGHARLTVAELEARLLDLFVMPRLLHKGGSLAVVDMLPMIAISGHGAIDPVEGAVWRVERRGKVDYLAKYLRPEKKDGIYLPEVSGKEAMWNWRPDV